MTQRTFSTTDNRSQAGGMSVGHDREADSARSRRRRLLAAILRPVATRFAESRTPAVAISAALLAASSLGLGGGTMVEMAQAQEACCFQPSYRLQCETVMEPQTVQRFRIAYETDYVEEEVVSYRPVLRTRTEEREVRVARPVTETSFREERYTIHRPVTETSYRDEEFTQTRMITETSEREEQVTTFRPVVETQMTEQQFMVQRPVVETQFVQQQHQVQRPVVETQFQTQQHVAMRPVTTIQNQTIDAGGFVNQQTVQPGQVNWGLQWVPRAVQTTGPLGIFSVNRGAAVWTPQVTPPTVQNQMVYRPNLVTQQVAQTSFVPEIQQQQVPVQVMRMQTETVTQQVPVQVTRMQSETVTQQVPVQTTRMVPMVETRKVPVTVQRPVTETMTRRVPVQQQRWVAEEQVRRVPVTSTRVEYETRKEPIQVQFYEQERVVQKVRRPVTRQTYVPYTETIMVPRQVVQRTPLTYFDPFAPAIISGHSSLGSSSSLATPSTLTPADPVTSGRPAIENGSKNGEKTEAAKPADNDADANGPSILAPPANAAQPRVGGYDAGTPEKVDATQESATPSASDEPANGDEASDDDELKAPLLNANGAGYRIQYRPLLTREI
jgi:hypothetical protein